MADVVCQSCRAESPEGARFCMACGTELERRCPSCGAPSPPAARFCPACGTPLGASAAPPPSAAPQAPPAAPEAPAEERRQVTVVFADLSGYTAVAEGMDPEAVKALVDRTLRRLGEEVTRFGGQVDKFIGDNVMAIFGAPVAHEDDAERAVRSALAMQAAMGEINADLDRRWSGVSFALRVGVNSGEVLAGQVGDRYTVIGDTVNVAARLQAIGRPGSITVGERTQRASARAIVYEPLEPLTLKGKAEPVRAFEAMSAVADAPARGRAGHEAPLVGRSQELALLDSIYARVAGELRPHLVTLLGSAGVGKSRLLRELEARLAARDPRPAVRHGRCLPYGSSVVFWALGEVVRADCGIVEGDEPGAVWRKLLGRVSELADAAGARVPADSAPRSAALIARLLGIEVPEALAAPESLDPQRVRDASFSVVRWVVETMAAERPLLLAFEDIHWADDGMLDLIEHLAQWVDGPLLLVCLARDELLERRGSWGGGRGSATSVFLEPLTDAETHDLVGGLLPPGTDVPDLLPVVAERAGGNPFFAEEMVRRLLEEGASDATALPDTVQALLAARLDALGGFERRLVQQAAVVGRTFWPDLLAHLAGAEAGNLDRALGALREKDILVPGDGLHLGGEGELAFKHVLIRDVAYGMLPKAVRARRHFDVGEYIEDRAGERSDEVVALLAEHYGNAAALGREARFDPDELGPMEAKAARFLEGAGDAAAALYSNSEAFSHYEAARRGSPEPGDRARIGEKQGDVALRLGRVDAAIGVWQACLEHHSQHQDLERVGALHRKIGAALGHKGERKAAIEHYQAGINLLKDEPPSLELVRLYEEAAWMYMQTGDNMLAIYASEKALRLAERMGETGAAARAHGIFGRVFGRIGDTEKARENLERSVELARGSDPGETILALLALGHHLEISEAEYAAAREAYGEGLALAQEIGDVPAQVELHAGLAQLAVHRADWEGVQRSMDASASLAEREGLVGKQCLPYALRAVLHWRDGEWDEAEPLYRRAHELAVQLGWSEVAFAALFGLAATLRDRGDPGGAVSTLSQALEVCERAGLVGQSIQATAARAVALAQAGDAGAARVAAEEAVELSGRLHDRVGEAAATEAEGVARVGAQAAATLRSARVRWQALARPIDAARSELLAGQALLACDPAAAAEALARAAQEYERLGIAHQARLARDGAVH
ncbi:MAG TPA: adenylate/guanylate cyclase domain-containing protein [Solirubrobacteraceae bacterium]|nr:adenylate/guanylate cyclase domain-containing protein [Solirubrobacteraceae bacterium]